jgi:hypothetical protein
LLSSALSKGASLFPKISASVCLLLSVSSGLSACPADSSAAPVAVFQGVAVYGGQKPRVEASGNIANWEGDVLEFVAVEASGRNYESLLSLNCRPSSMQAALLLLGCKPGEKTGTRLSLELEWTADGRPRRATVEEMLLERRTRKAPGALPWIFTGSQFVRLPGGAAEVFVADAEEAFIGLYAHSGLLIQLAGDHGNPYRSAEAGFAPNADRLPPKGAPVTLVLKIRP